MHTLFRCIYMYITVHYTLERQHKNSRYNRTSNPESWQVMRAFEAVVIVRLLSKGFILPVHNLVNTIVILYLFIYLFF